MKFDKYLLISIIILCLISVCAVSATNVSAADPDNTTLSNNTTNINPINDSTITQVNDSVNTTNTGLTNETNNTQNISNSNSSSKNITTDNENGTITDNSLKNYTITNDNFNTYFDENGVLKSEYGGGIILFTGNFTDKGVITISSPGTRITGLNALFNNTVFSLNAPNIILTNLNFILNQEFTDNAGAGILINGNNITVYNITMKYTLPSDVTGIGIYSNGTKNLTLESLKLINNTINFVGNSLHSGFNYGVLITYTEDAYVYGNHINCTLPLRSVNWGSGIFGGSSMDAVAAFVADTSENLTLSHNNIYASVNGAAQGYPTLDCCLIYACDESLIENNNITEEDFYTKNGTDNYLQALDLYLLNDVTVIGNTILVNTTGGKIAHGTAYPIQVNGPAYNIKIAFNHITSINNGPNIGIYSENYYGATQIDIISNFINVTGLASTHYWALVAGIEAQDSDDKMLNNTIIVTNIGNTTSGDNIYGISYSQNTNGDHTYNIQYNNITVNEQYAIALKSGSNSKVINSIVANNILVSSGAGGSRAVTIDSNGYNNTVWNNTNGAIPKNQMSSNYYPTWLQNYLNKDLVDKTPDLSWITQVINKNTGNGTGLGNGTGTGIGNTTHPSSGTGSGTNPGTGSSTGSGTGSGSGTIISPLVPENTGDGIGSGTITINTGNGTINITIPITPVSPNTNTGNTTEPSNQTNPINPTNPSQTSNNTGSNSETSTITNNTSNSNSGTSSSNTQSSTASSSPGESNSPISQTGSTYSATSNSNSNNGGSSSNVGSSTNKASSTTSSKSDSSGTTGGSSAKAYAINTTTPKTTNDNGKNILLAVAMIIIVLGLILVGYRHNKQEDD